MAFRPKLPGSLERISTIVTICTFETLSIKVHVLKHAFTPFPFFLHATYAATQVKNQMIHINSFIFLKRIYNEISLVVKSHCLSLIHGLLTTGSD